MVKERQCEKVWCAQAPGAKSDVYYCHVSKQQQQQQQQVGSDSEIP